MKMEGGEGMIEIDGRSVSSIFGYGKVVGRGVFGLEGNADRSRNALQMRIATYNYGLSLTLGNGRVGDGGLRTRNAVVENEGDIVLLRSGLRFLATNPCSPFVSILDIIHVEFHEVVNIGECLRAETASVELLPAPAFDVIFPSAVMTNAVQPRSFKPHNSRLQGIETVLRVLNESPLIESAFQSRDWASTWFPLH